MGHVIRGETPAWLSNFGSGDGDGDGDGDGGYGDGSGYGYGFGYGYGYDSGSGSGDGYGYGYGDGSGCGYGGSCCGYGYGGYGYGYGDGDGSGYGDGDGCYGSSDGDGGGYGYGDGDGDGDGCYGSSDGDGGGYGYGYGDGDGEYWSACIDQYAQLWPQALRARLASVRHEGATIAYWRSSADGTACNGGRNNPVAPGTVETAEGPLLLCNPSGTLHATLLPPKWDGERVWIVALHGDVIGDEQKLGALKREIIGECLSRPAEASRE